jgi:hypothetical protein
VLKGMKKVILIVVAMGTVLVLVLKQYQSASANTKVSAVLGTVSSAQQTEPQQPADIIKSFLAPVVFYGKVQTQDGLSVADAKISYSLADRFGGGSSKATTQSDQQGFFKIIGIGLSLSVQVTKEGYFSIPDKDGRSEKSASAFDYGADFGHGIHHPDKKAPVIFTLYKPDAIEPLTQVKKQIMMPRDGTPVSVPLDIPNRQIVLKCWTEDDKRAPDGRYNWKLEVSCVNGGIQRHDDDLTFVAPSDGFAQSDLIEMPRTLARPDWHDDFERSYWVKFNDGTFGSLKVRMVAGGAHFAIVRGHINPKQGSRNLEVDPAKNH